MMKTFKWNQIQIAAALTALLLVPSIGHAEYYGGGSYDAGAVSKDIGKVKSVLDPAADQLGRSAKGARGEDSERFDVQERLKEVEEQLTRNRQERELRQKVQGGTNTIDRLKAAKALPAILDANIAQNREAKNRELETLVTQLQTPASAINPNDLNLNSLENACRKNVDFTQFKTLAEQMNSQPFQYLRTQGQKLLEEKNEDAKKEKLATLQKLAAQFEEAADQDPSLRVQNGQQSVLDQGAQDEDSRILDLEKVWKNQKAKIKDLRKALVSSVFTDFIPKLSQIEENDAKISELANHFADNLEQFRKASYDQAIVNSQQLYKNCENVEEKLGENVMSPGSMYNAAYQWVLSYNKAYAPQFLAQMDQVRRDVRCTDVTPQVDSLFGGNLANAINQLRTAQDPQTLLQLSMATMQNIGNAQAQVGQAIRPLMDDCQFAAKNEEKIKDFIGGVQQAKQQLQTQQDQEPVARGARGTGSQVRSLRGGATRSNGAVTHRSGSLRR